MTDQNTLHEEISRLKDLKSYLILDTDTDADFDKLARLVAAVCEAPIATITLIDEKREWFKSCIGLNNRENDRDIAFCAHAILSSKPLIIEDTLEDPRFSKNPMVIEGPYIRFYAGVPLISPKGYALGTLAIKDIKPRKLTTLQLQTLITLASQVMVSLERHRQNHILNKLNQALEIKTTELEKKSEFLNALLESLSEGIVACDETGKLSLFNHATRELHGQHDSSLPPERWAESFDLFMPDGKTRMQPNQIPLYRAYLGEKIKDQTLVIAPKNQSARFVLCNGQPIVTANGEKLGAVVAMRNITLEKAKEQALIKSKSKFASVFNQTYLFQALMNAEGTMLDVNDTCMDLCGYQRSQAIGKKFWQGPWWSPDAQISDYIKDVVEAGQRGQTVQAASDYLTASGERRQTEFTLSLIKDSQGQIEFLLATGLDVTERKRKERFLSGQNNILKSISAGVSLHEIMRSIVGLMEQQLPEMMGSILLLDEESQCLYHGASIQLPEYYIQAIDGMNIGTNVGACGTAAYEKRIVIVEDTTSDICCANFADLLKKYQLKACWSVPFFSKTGDVLGTLAVYARQSKTPSTDELVLVEAAANLLSIAVERDMTSRALHNSNAMMEATFNYADVGIVVADIHGQFIRANRSYCNMMGYPEIELQALDFLSITYPEDRDYYQAKLTELISGDINSFGLEKRSLRKDGSIIWAKVSASLIRDTAGSPINIIAITEDITPAKEAAKALQETQSLLNIASHVAHMGAWSVDVATMELRLSDEAIAIHEEPEDFAPSVEQAINYYPHEYREFVQNFVTACIENGISFDEELEFITGQGRRIWVRSIGQALRDADGHITRIAGAIIDIDELKRAEQDKLASLNRIQRIASRLPGMIYEFRLRPDGSTSMPYASDYIRALFRIDPQDVVNDASAAFQQIHPDDLDKIHASIRESAATLNTWQHEFRLRFENGDVTWLRGNAMPQLEKDGSVLWHGFITDITASRKSQEQLRLLEMCVSRLNDIVLISEAEPINEPGPRIVFVNDAFERRTGYSGEEVIGKTPRILQGEKTQRKELDRIRGALEKWQPVRAELINYTKSGEEFWLELDIVPVPDEKGWYTHWIAVERDITERKLVEIELQRLNRALRLRSALAELINTANDEQTLLNDACQLAIDVGGYCTCWVGYAQNDKTKSIKRVAAKGSAVEYVMNIDISWSADVPQGQGPAGRTIRSGMPVVCEDFVHDPAFAPWVNNALKYGLYGVVSLPLNDKTYTFGLFSLFLYEPRQVATEEIALLKSLADDLAFGIMSLRTRKQQQRAQQAIVKVAATVSASAETPFFAQLNRNMAEAMNADAAFISKLLPGEPLHAQTLTAIVHDNIIDNFNYLIADSPCRKLMLEEQCVVIDGFAEGFPNFVALKRLKVESYVGRRLLNTAGEVVGMIALLYCKPLQDADFLLSTLKIFAARAAAELERQAADSRILQQASLLDKAQDAIIVRSLDHQILFWNKSAERLYGWTAGEAIESKSDKLLYDDPNDFYHANSFLMEYGEWNGEIQQRRKDGSTITIEGRWTLVCDDNGKPESILCINTDITERKAAQDKIQQLAFYDPLTLLPNRLLLVDRLNQILAARLRNHKISALLFIDLDNFKKLNDTLGHSIGDILLKEAAQRINECIRACDTVARFGGDEFVVMITELSDVKSIAYKQAQQVAEKISATLNQSYQLANHTHYSTSSIGVTLIDQESNTVEELLKQADLAMYEAKAAGKNTYRFYQKTMQAAINIRVSLEEDLREALLNHEFLLHYQPQLNSNGEIEGAEVLIRWIHPERGMISPAQFIPIAEETKLILPIGTWVLKTVCQQLVCWAEHKKTASLVIAVNVSIHQFNQRNFVTQIQRLLDETGANPNRLKLELTESLFVDNVEDVIEKMTALKALGIQFSLDDFGTGYSSLSYLKTLPLDQLKIDQSFVRDILVDPNDASIARAIITLAQNLGLNVIAEGVETEEQRKFLLENNCLAYQGYLFSRPLPIDQFEEYIMTKAIANV